MISKVRDKSDIRILLNKDYIEYSPKVIVSETKDFINHYLKSILIIKIKSLNNQIEHWLNGVKILEYEYGSLDLKNLIIKSKFKDMPYFAKASSGRIGLQGDHGEVWYRNVRIRKL